MITFKTKRERFVWLAGLIDGEGSISLSFSNYKRNNGKYNYKLCYGRLSIWNNDVALLNQVKKTFPIFVVRSHRANFHKLKYASLEKKQELKVLIKNILPFLITKKERAEILLKYANQDKVSGEYVRKLSNMMAKLNKRGGEAGV